MAVLPWGNSRSQINNKADKVKATGLDWFSRTTAEPSRQAINQLLKQQCQGGSGTSVRSRSHSRASTPTSQISQHRPTTSVDSRPKLTVATTSDQTMLSHSRPSTPVRPNTATLERSDSSSRSLFQKGGLLRRTGSKLSMNSNPSPAGSVISPSRNTPSRAGSREKDVFNSPTRDDGRCSSISKPFDFAHIMHGDINAFTGLGRIDESDLASQFDAIQARYRTTTASGEPLPQEPHNLAPVPAPLPKPIAGGRPTTPIQPLPLVPPKNSPPAPPAKDHTTSLPPLKSIRTSRSTENFSRPTSRSPSTTFTVSPIRSPSSHIHHHTAVCCTEVTLESERSKPLPQIPCAIHAVSTEDNTARPLIAAPLPSPPIYPETTVSRHHRQSAFRGSLRHVSTFPSSRNPAVGTLMHEGQLLRINEEDGLARPHSGYALTNTSYGYSEEMPSSGDKQLQMEEWEVAIDNAWDLEDDAEYVGRRARPLSSLSRTCESTLTMEQPILEAASSPSTPLMMMRPAKRSPSSASTGRAVSAVEIGNENPRGHKNNDSLIGLGIDTESRPQVASRTSRPPALEIVTTSNVHRPNNSPRLTRSAYSAISHSSSQESIILSIASSIMSTQRSSISSISVSDYNQSAKQDRLSISNSSSSPLLTVNSPKAARPESGCLPSTLLPHLKPESNKAARPDSTCLPSALGSKRNSLNAKAKRSDSTSMAQDMTSTFSIPEGSSLEEVSALSRSQSADLEGENDLVAELPSEDRQIQTQPGCRTSVSSRLSSMTSSETPTIRQRSSTQNSRTRSVRASYSLFPSAGALTHTTSSVDVDAVAS